LFRKEHFFRGSDNDDQLLRIMKALGTIRFDEYLRTYAIHFETDHAGLLEKCALIANLISYFTHATTISLCSYPSQPWTRFVTAENQQNVSLESLDLLDKLLRYDHSNRLTAREAQGHAFFSTTLNPLLTYYLITFF
jgi:casein kinase II subunit alpha